MEFLRGGGPRYHYNNPLLRSFKGQHNPTLLLNQSLPAAYKDVFSPKRMTRRQLQIILGIELHYGNFEDLKYNFAAQAIPELADYFRIKADLDRAIEASGEIMETEGIQVFQKHLARIDELRDDLHHAVESLRPKKKELKQFGIQPEDIPGLLGEELTEGEML